MGRYLSDETWRSLDPHAGRLDARGAWLALGAGLAGIAVLVAAVVVHYSGVVSPHLRAPGSSGYGFVEDTRVFFYDFEVVNDGWRPVEVTRAGRDGPGLRPVDPTTAAALGDRDPDPSWQEPRLLLPGVVPAGGSGWVRLAYEVTDCDAVPTGSWPVPLRISRPWGTVTEWIELPTQRPSDFRLPPAATSAGPASGTTRSRSGPGPETHWQRNLADAACYRDESTPYDPESGDVP